MCILRIILIYFVVFLIPVLLIIAFPQSSSLLVELFKALIFWGAIISILLLFKEVIKKFIASAADRLEKAKLPGGLELSFNPQKELSSIDESKKLKQDLETTKQALKTESGIAWNYFILFIASTIYGTQFRLLKHLITFGPKPIEDIKLYYEIFKNKTNNQLAYPFESYLAYLTTNFLIQFNSEKKYEITQPGRVLMERLEALGYTKERFQN